jgi:hypothetical protein
VRVSNRKQTMLTAQPPSITYDFHGV